FIDILHLPLPCLFCLITPLLCRQQCLPVLIQRIIPHTSTVVLLPLQSLPTRSELIASQAYYMEWIHHSPGGGKKFLTCGGIALESVHGHNAYWLATGRVSVREPVPQCIGTAAFDHIQ